MATRKIKFKTSHQVLKEISNQHKRIKKIHGTYHKFHAWLVKTFSKGVPDHLQRHLAGYEVMETVEKWIKRNAPEIKICWCDDDHHASSMLLLIPHPDLGITVMFIPQLTSVQNQFFLYGNHYQKLMEELGKMGKVYKNKKY